MCVTSALDVKHSWVSHDQHVLKEAKWPKKQYKYYKEVVNTEFNTQQHFHNKFTSYNWSFEALLISYLKNCPLCSQVEVALCSWTVQ